MLDVHPPHTPTHTWRDFLIHIATIIVGLLIAVGLEQTVEWLHHRHQREQLIEEIHKDCKVNQQYIEDDITAAEYVMDWARAQASAIERAGPTAPVTMPRMAAGKIGRPDAGVWPAAKANGQASLLSTGEQNWFDDIDLVHNQLFVSSNSSTAKLYDAFQALDQAILDRATNTPSGDFDLSALNPTQRTAVVESLRSIASQARNVLQSLIAYLCDIEYILSTPGDQLDAPAGLNHYLEIARKNSLAHPGIRYNFISN
jgi:hypothetical protein